MFNNNKITTTLLLTTSLALFQNYIAFASDSESVAEYGRAVSPVMTLRDRVFKDHAAHMAHHQNLRAGIYSDSELDEPTRQEVESVADDGYITNVQNEVHIQNLIDGCYNDSDFDEQTNQDGENAADDEFDSDALNRTIEATEKIWREIKKEREQTTIRIQKQIASIIREGNLKKAQKAYDEACKNPDFCEDHKSMYAAARDKIIDMREMQEVLDTLRGERQPFRHWLTEVRRLTPKLQYNPNPKDYYDRAKAYFELKDLDPKYLVLLGLAKPINDALRDYCSELVERIRIIDDALRDCCSGLELECSPIMKTKLTRMRAIISYKRSMVETVYSRKLSILDDAILDYTQLINNVGKGKSFDFHFGRALCYEKKGKNELAKKDFEQCLTCKGITPKQQKIALLGITRVRKVTSSQDLTVEQLSTQLMAERSAREKLARQLSEEKRAREKLAEQVQELQEATQPSRKRKFGGGSENVPAAKRARVSPKD